MGVLVWYNCGTEIKWHIKMYVTSQFDDSEFTFGGRNINFLQGYYQNYNEVHRILTQSSIYTHCVRKKVTPCIRFHIFRKQSLI